MVSLTCNFVSVSFCQLSVVSLTSSVSLILFFNLCLPVSFAFYLLSLVSLTLSLYLSHLVSIVGCLFSGFFSFLSLCLSFYICPLFPFHFVFISLSHFVSIPICLLSTLTLSLIFVFCLLMKYQPLTRK